jgi:hypothetical protein
VSESTQTIVSLVGGFGLMLMSFIMSGQLTDRLPAKANKVAGIIAIVFFFSGILLLFSICARSGRNPCEGVPYERCLEIQYEQKYDNVEKPGRY